MVQRKQYIYETWECRSRSSSHFSEVLGPVGGRAKEVRGREEWPGDIERELWALRSVKKDAGNVGPERARVGCPRWVDPSGPVNHGELRGRVLERGKKLEKKNRKKKNRLTPVRKIYVSSQHEKQRERERGGWIPGRQTTSGKKRSLRTDRCLNSYIESGGCSTCELSKIVVIAAG